MQEIKNVEIIDSKDPSVQLTVNKLNTKDFFKDLSDEMKSFKHQITLKLLLRKQKENTEREFAPVYVTSTN